jgi:hypothetical protein
MIVVAKEKRSKEITRNLDSRQVFANKPFIPELTWWVRTWRRSDGIRFCGGAVRVGLGKRC